MYSFVNWEQKKKTLFTMKYISVKCIYVALYFRSKAMWDYDTLFLCGNISEKCLKNQKADYYWHE